MVAKDIEVERLKSHIGRYEQYLKSKANLSEKDISEIVSGAGPSKTEETKTDEGSFLDSGRYSDLSQSANQYIKQLGDQTSGEYVKNVFIKYLVYLASKNYKEISTLERVLYTVLQVNREE